MRSGRRSGYPSAETVSWLAIINTPVTSGFSDNEARACATDFMDQFLITLEPAPDGTVCDHSHSMISVTSGVAMNLLPRLD